jgi:dTMP kinase
MSGLFIVLEGIDGSGSTTQGDRLTVHLQRRGYPTVFTHEPTGGPAGMLIRLALEGRLTGSGRPALDPGPKNELDPETMALLYAADRVDHLRTKVEPALASGRHVVCDRYVLSSLAYQGLTSEQDWLLEINRNIRVPDLTIYLDIDAASAKRRMRQTRFSEDLYEAEAILEQVRENYLKLIANESERFGRIITLDASARRESVTAQIADAVDRLTGSRNLDEDRMLPLQFLDPE